MFLSENVIFHGLRLSLGHFGQQAPERHVSMLQDGVSTFPLPPFIVDLLTFKDYPRSNSFFSMGILEGVKRQTLRAPYNRLLPFMKWGKAVKKLFLTLKTGTCGARNENLRPVLKSCLWRGNLVSNLTGSLGDIFCTKNIQNKFYTKESKRIESSSFPDLNQMLYLNQIIHIFHKKCSDIFGTIYYLVLLGKN